MMDVPANYSATQAAYERFLADVRLEAGRIDLSRFPAPMTIEVLDLARVSCYGVAVRISMPVKDIRHGFPTTVNAEEIALYGKFKPRKMIELVYGLARGLVLHELAECFYVDGKTLTDPHKDERT